MSTWRAVRMWWLEPTDYDWLLSTLRYHSALNLVKSLIGMSGLGLSVVGTMLLLSAEGPQHAPGRAAIGVIAIISVLMALRWLVLPWPTVSASLGSMVVADVAITTVCLLVTSRVAMLNITTLILTGGYITVFHSAKILAAHAGWALFSVLIVMIRMIAADSDRNIPLAVATTLIMVLAVVFVLPALQFVFWVLRTDALSDPLTTLLNRRGLDYHLPRLFQSGPPTCAMIIDLDRFKVVNDTFGHQEGDRVLARTAARLRATVGPAATIARTGGEEFTIIDHLDAASARALAERLRHAVEDSTEVTVPVTVSIGVAVCEHATADERCLPSERLLACADQAMYQAKEQGGNAVSLRELRQPLP
ncbi:GGDEF domain-containing protein [Nocardia arizonensis]|uniref:GGDEF domain-containing protein n=1 Tax=Nocardia arizonensis TaxID=1141647 RepID=UPI000A85680D|nr:GGDEF domain-containing protein [Nocardia arizonensis]